MSRFDDFAKSSAAGRGIFGALRRSDAGGKPKVEAGVSRRDLIKKAGLVGGAAVISSTLIQSVVSPAVAVSPGPCIDPVRGCGGSLCPSPLCPVGGQCTNNTQCVDGTLCSPTGHGTCRSYPGSPVGCSGDSECTSAYCDDGVCKDAPRNQSAGAECHADTPERAAMQCASLVCVNGRCGVSAATPVTNGQPCTGTGTQARDASCASGYCGGTTCEEQPSDVSNGSTCHAATYVQANAQCETGNECAGATATSPSGVCKRIGGQACTAGGECASNVCQTLAPGQKVCA